MPTIKVKNNGVWEHIAIGGGSGNIDIDLDGSNTSEPNYVNADTLGGKPENELSVADSMKLGGSSLDDVKTYVNNQITNRVIHSGGKNLLKNTTKSQTVNGITFTVNDDGSITVNGTNNTQSADTDFYIWGSNVDNGSYIHMPKGSRISGFTENGGNYLVIGREKTRGALLTTYNINSALAESDCYFYGIFYRVSAGITVDNVTLYPMVRLASETDDTYEPYYEGLKEVHNKLSMELLWENASLDSEFAAQTVMLSLNEVTKIEIIYRNIISDEKSSSAIAYTNVLEWNFNAVDNNGKNVSRYLALNDNSVYFGNGYEYSSYGSYSINNTVLIPYRIYGIKGVVE